jgi:hypothetical protein
VTEELQKCRDSLMATGGVDLFAVLERTGLLSKRLRRK